MKDTDEIFEEMAGEVESRAGVVVNRGGDMAIRLYAVAAELASLWVQADWLKRQSFPQTAIGEYLDRHAEVRGLERGESVCATGTVRFETDEAGSADLSVPSGTVCLNSAGTEFLTTEDSVIAAGSTFCLAGAKARNGGSSGNVPAGSVCFMSLAPVGVVRCYNPAAFTGGADEESDDALRVRVLKSYASLPNGSNAAFYEEAALETDGVAAVCVMPRERGLGTVDLIIAGADGIPSETLISGLKASLDEQREICVDVDVKAPTAVSVDVSAAVDIEDGFDSDTVLGEVSAAVSALFDGTMLGKDVLLAKLGNVIYGVPGVCNYVISLPEADIAVAYDELPVAGTITATRR